MQLTMLALADYGDDNGEQIYPSRAKLAEKVGMSESQTKRVVANLLSIGVLECVRNQHGGARGATRHYRIVFDALTGRADALRRGRVRAPREGAQIGTGTGRINGHEGAHISAETGRTDAPQPLKEPLLTGKREPKAAAPAARGVRSPRFGNRGKKKSNPLAEMRYGETGDV